MGIYFDNTTPEEDARIILKLIQKGDAYYKDGFIYRNDPDDNYILWKRQEHVDSNSIIQDKFIIFEEYGKGILTTHGVDSIYSELMRKGKFSTTYSFSLFS